jgi:hypothetical protein
MKAPCPICYAPMTRYTDYIDGHTLCESSEDCPYGCYFHHYGYGYTEVMVNIRGHRIMFGHSYLDEFADTQAEWEAVQSLFEPARAALIEDLRTKIHGQTDRSSS